MGANSQKITEMERHVELAFGYGRYACAGKTIAMMELFKFFFEVGFNSLCNWSGWVRFHANWVVVYLSYSESSISKLLTLLVLGTRGSFSTFQIKDMWVRVTERVETV